MQQTRTFVIRALIALALAHGAAAQTAPTVVISPTPKLAFFDNNGKPLAGGCVATYAAGTTTPLQTFTDATGMVPNQNPVMLDASGRAGIWISVPSIKYVVKAKSSACSLSSGTILYTVDHVQDSGLLLRSDLAGANGAGNIGFQQPGGTPITVGAALSICPDASHYANFAAAIANVPAGGCLNVTTQMSGPVTISNSVTINGYPGGSVRATSNTPAIRITNATGVKINGLAVDGRFSQSAFTGSCVHVTGSSYVTIENSPSISNCGAFGVYFDGNTTINQHVKVLNSTFTANQADSVYSQGLLYDAEWAGNYADGSTNAPASHTFAVHYQQAGTTPPHAIKIHDNVLVAGPYFAIEIGSFIAPYAKTSWPYDVHLSHNTCLIALTGSGCDSLSDVQDFSVDYETADAQGHVMLYMPEIIGSNGTVHGVVQKNCNTSQTVAFVLNQSADIDASGNSFCGSILVGISGPAGNVLDIPMDDNRVHDNSITLQPGYTAAVMAGGGHPAGIWVQLNDPLVHMHHLDIHDNTITGNSTSDGTVGVLLENDPCTSTANIDQVHVHHNVINAIQYGLGNQTGCTFTTNVNFTDNLLGSGMAQFFNFSFPSITYRNLGFPSPVPVNSGIYRPTACVTGTGLDAGGINCLPNLRGGGAPGAGAGTQTAYSGTLIWNTATPASGALFTLTMPPGAFSAGPICQAFSTYFNPQTVLFSISSSNTATSVSFFSYSVLPAGAQVEIAWHCEPN